MLNPNLKKICNNLKIADTVRFYINEYTTLAPKAEPWLAMLTGVADPTS